MMTYRKLGQPLRDDIMDAITGRWKCAGCDQANGPVDWRHEVKTEHGLELYCRYCCKQNG